MNEARLSMEPWLLCPWDYPGKNMGVGCHFLLQGIFPTRGPNPSLLWHLHGQVDSFPPSYLRSSTVDSAGHYLGLPPGAALVSLRIPHLIQHAFHSQRYPRFCYLTL